MKGYHWTLVFMVVFLLACFVSGCATTQGPKPPKETDIPIPAPCVKKADVPQAPDFADSDAKLKAVQDKPDQLAAAYAAGRVQHYAFEAEQGVVIAKCAQP